MPPWQKKHQLKANEKIGANRRRRRRRADAASGKGWAAPVHPAPRASAQVSR
jgi:hypothetical protein